jgi:hypothetical protein
LRRVAFAEGAALTPPFRVHTNSWRTDLLPVWAVGVEGGRRGVRGKGEREGAPRAGP